MTILKYLIVIALLSGWAVGYFGFQTGKEIHLLLGMALISLSVIIIGEDGFLYKKNLPE